MQTERLEQLDRARKLGVNVHVLFGKGAGRPMIVKLDHVKTHHVENSERGYVQVTAWRHELQQVTVVVTQGEAQRLTTAALVQSVETALERFQAKYSAR